MLYNVTVRVLLQSDYEIWGVIRSKAIISHLMSGKVANIEIHLLMVKMQFSSRAFIQPNNTDTIYLAKVWIFHSIKITLMLKIHLFSFLFVFFFSYRDNISLVNGELKQGPRATTPLCVVTAGRTVFALPLFWKLQFFTLNTSYVRIWPAQWLVMCREKNIIFCSRRKQKTSCHET